MSLLDDLSDFLEGVRDFSHEIDGFKADIVSSFIEPVKDLNSQITDSSKELMGESPNSADSSKNLPPAGE